MKRTKTPPPAEDLGACVAALEAELARVKALAEGAQRAIVRGNARFEDVCAALTEAGRHGEQDPYRTVEVLDGDLNDEEDGRVARIIRGEPAEGERFHKQKA